MNEKTGEWETSCACGARWTHPVSRTAKDMADIYESHLKYYTRKKMETL